MTQALYVPSKKCLDKSGHTVPWGNILSQQTVWGCWLTPRPLASTRFPCSDLLLFIASGLYTHTVCHGLWPPASPWAPSRTARGAGPKSPDSTDKPIGGWWQPEAYFPAFFSFPTPCLATQSWAWLYRLNTHKKLFCLAIHLPNGASSHGVNWL